MMSGSMLRSASRFARPMCGARTFAAGSSIGTYDNVIAEVYVCSLRIKLVP